MTKEDVFNAWVGTMSMYGAFFSLVAREVGMEKALKMHAAGAEPFGDRMGRALKDELGGKKIGIDALLKMRSPMMAS